MSATNKARRQKNQLRNLIVPELINFTKLNPSDYITHLFALIDSERDAEVTVDRDEQSQMMKRFVKTFKKREEVK